MKKDYHKGKKINAYINDEDYNSLYQYAAELGLNMSDLIRDAIHSYLLDNIPSDNQAAVVRRATYRAYRSGKTHAKVDTLYNNSDTHK